MKRGDIVTVALQGSAGKPRPALIIQSDTFAHTPTIVVLPLTSDLTPAPLMRVTIEPTAQNGLRKALLVMINRVTLCSRNQIGSVIGQIDEDAMLQVNRALAVFLGIAG